MKRPGFLAALLQTLAFYTAHGITIQRVLTFQGSTYHSKRFAAACQQLGLQHRFTKPYCPKPTARPSVSS